MAATETLSAAYQAAVPSTGAWAIKATVTAAAQRLGALVTIPAIPKEMAQPGSEKTRPPRHVFFQVDPAAANVVWMTFDNVTTPVVGGPGLALVAGSVWKFELVGGALIPTSNFADSGHSVNSASAFQFIATANTVMNVHFSD